MFWTLIMQEPYLSASSMVCSTLVLNEAVSAFVVLGQTASSAKRCDCQILNQTPDKTSKMPLYSAIWASLSSISLCQPLCPGT